MDNANTLVDLHQQKQDELLGQITLDRQLRKIFFNYEPTLDDMNELHKLEQAHVKNKNYHLATTVRNFIKTFV